tara:strand:+ start:519 stop:1283 length:765 start_codon:yes stop_codon:yes gene_type:complete
MVLFRLIVLLVALVSVHARAEQQPVPVEEAVPLWQQSQAYQIDPWEPLNRKVFVFNENLDKYALKPVAQAYRFVTPDPVERGVTNFIRNIYEFNTILNSILQGRAENTIHGLGRLLINTTIGLGGFLDVASSMGVDHRPADFGQTLSVWGLDAGPYLVVPVVGPRTVRSGTGVLVDSYFTLPSLSDERAFNWGFLGAETIDIRARLLRADELISGDKYIFLRQAYLSRREAFLNNGEVDDSFSDFEEGGEFEEF